MNGVRKADKIPKREREKGERENEKTRGGAGAEIEVAERDVMKWVLGSLDAASASDIYHTNPSMAHL